MEIYVANQTLNLWQKKTKTINEIQKFKNIDNVFN